MELSSLFDIEGAVKFIFGFLFLFSFNASAAATCGLYQIEDYGQEVLYSLWTFGPHTTEQQDYTVLNPDSSLVRQMFSGSCYCVDGNISGRKIEITQIERGPYYNCVPGGGPI